MPRPKGSRNKKTLEKETLVIQKKQQKRLDDDHNYEHIKQLREKEGTPVLPKYVLKLTDWLYITCDKYNWMICEVNDKINPNTGEKYPDRPFLFAGNLNQILHIATNYMIRVPVDLWKLTQKIQEIHDLIDDRVPTNTNPKDFLEIREENK